MVLGLEDDADVDGVVARLLAAGGRDVRPEPSLPGVVTADFPAETEVGVSGGAVDVQDVDVQDLVRRLEALAGVRYAEPVQSRRLG
jgi:hypothetical protein